MLDIEYKQKLAAHIECDDINKLKSVVGPQQLKLLLQELTAENYTTGKNLENTKNGNYIANLHLHTMASDGEFTPEKLFAQIREYINQGNVNRFIVAITDHDHLLGVKNALSYIADNHELMENILFVPGIELNCRYESPKYLIKPIQIELLAYCINPFELDINRLLNKKIQQNRIIINDAINELADHGANIIDASIHCPFIRNLCGPAIDIFLREYFSRIGIPSNKIDSVFEKYHDRFVGLCVTSADPTLQEIIASVGDSVVSLAHPTRIMITEHLLPDQKDDTNKVFRHLIKELHSLRGQVSDIAIETNYQMYKWFVWDDNNAFVRREKLCLELCKEFKILQTGGMDTHGLSIFSR